MKSYPFIVEVDGVRERWDVEARSVSDALFQLGVEYGLENPDLIPSAIEFKITKLWGNP